MESTKIIISHLAQGPALLRDLLNSIPKERYKERRLPGRWTIHEHACHLSEVDSMMYDRLLTFKNADYPVFEPFLPGTNVGDAHLIDLDLEECLRRFEKMRGKTVELAGTLSPEDWRKEATHPEYEYYTAKILLRHMLMHDNLHMYRMEQLWLTREAFLLD